MTARRKHGESDIYHVITRGVGKQNIFEEDVDNRYYLNLMRKLARKEGVVIFAWCLMDNHTHLLAQAPLEIMSSFMQNLSAAYATYYNEKYDRVGHLFQGRFLSEPVEGDDHFLTVLRYIHQNPQKAGICPLERYAWSSYMEYLSAADICDTSLGKALFGSRQSFVNFHRMDGGVLPCLSADETLHTASDETLREVASRVIGEDAFCRIGSLPKVQRNELLTNLKGAGLSVRQIERLTGLGRNIVARAVK